jgi:hypothetical protein
MLTCSSISDVQGADPSIRTLFKMNNLPPIFVFRPKPQVFMASIHPENKNIDFLRNIPDILPVKNQGYENWSIRVIRRAPTTCKNYLSPNRRDFYKIVYTTKGMGLFTIGLKTYYIDQPTILFLHPNEIISWQKLNTEASGFICFFSRSMADTHPLLKAQMDKYQLFTDSTKSVIRLSPADITELDRLFYQMEAVDTVHGGSLAEDAIPKPPDTRNPTLSRMSSGISMIFSSSWKKKPPTSTTTALYK